LDFTEQALIWLSSVPIIKTALELDLSIRENLSPSLHKLKH
jgi:hypothetical protein